MKRHGWVKPLINISCTYVAGDYPLTVRICFENGAVRRYRDDDLHQPAPGNYLKDDTGYTIGYQYKGPKKMKNRLHRSQL